jgi:hypothetical protein
MTKRMPFQLDDAVAQLVERIELMFVIAHKNSHIEIKHFVGRARA